MTDYQQHNLIYQDPNNHKRSSWFWTSILIVVVIVAAGIAAIAMVAHGHKEFSLPNAASQNQTLTVSAGESAVAISDDLFSKKLVPSAFWFRTYLRLKHLDDKVIAGTFTIPAGADIRQVAFQLTAVPDPNRITIRIPEGSTINQIAVIVQQQAGINQADFIAAEKTEAGQYDYLGAVNKPTIGSLEGYLFPDTYYFEKGVTADAILQKVLANTSAKITPDIRQQASANGLTMNQVITVASLIEKEVGTIGSVQRDPAVVQQERRTVAGIIYNRLNIGMALQLDSTKNYAPPGMNMADPAYDTYAHTALPPGPISNPSFDSIQAAADPLPSSYMYFITAPDGTAYFATTLAEQNANIVKYLKK